MLDKSNKKMRFEDLHWTDQSWADVWITTWTLFILLVRTSALDKYTVLVRTSALDKYTVTIFSLRRRNKYSNRVQIFMLHYEFIKA
jgi:hypothetical protein